MEVHDTYFKHWETIEEIEVPENFSEQESISTIFESFCYLLEEKDFIEAMFAGIESIYSKSGSKLDIEIFLIYINDRGKFYELILDSLNSIKYFSSNRQKLEFNIESIFFYNPLFIMYIGSLVRNNYISESGVFSTRKESPRSVPFLFDNWKKYFIGSLEFRLLEYYCYSAEKYEDAVERVEGILSDEKVIEFLKNC